MANSRSRTVALTLLAALAVAAVLAVGLSIDRPTARYAAYLLAFTLYMVWFVEVVVGLLRRRL